MHMAFRGSLPKRELEGQTKHFESSSSFVACHCEERFQRFVSEMLAFMRRELISNDGYRNFGSVHERSP